MRQQADEMLNEFLRSDEFRERSEMPEEEIAEISLSKESASPLANALRTIVKEFAKDPDNTSKIIKSVNVEINRMAVRDNG